jgi:hypothetical protein
MRARLEQCFANVGDVLEVAGADFDHRDRRLQSRE